MYFSATKRAKDRIMLAMNGMGTGTKIPRMDSAARAGWEGKEYIHPIMPPSMSDAIVKYDRKCPLYNVVGY